MKTALLNPLSGNIKIRYVQQGRSFTHRKKLGNGRSQQWDFSDLHVSMQKKDDLLEWNVSADDELHVQSLEVVLKIQKDWSPMLLGSMEGPWLFLGNRSKKEYCLIYCKGCGSHFQIIYHRSRKIRLKWSMDVKLKAGESFNPGSLDIIPGDPRISCRSLPLPPVYPKKIFLQKYRLLGGEGKKNLKAEILKNELLLCKEKKILLDGYIFLQSDLPKPMGINQKDRLNTMEQMLTDLRREGLKAGAVLSPLRVPKKDKLCQEKPHWFLHNQRGSAVTISTSKGHCQILDETHQEVQNYLFKWFEAYRSWGFVSFLLEGMDDLLLEGIRSSQQLSLIERISAWKALTRKSLGEGALVMGDHYFPTKEQDSWDGYFPRENQNDDNHGLMNQMDLFPLAVQGCILSAGPLYLNKKGTSHGEKIRERYYNLQLITGGLAMLAGPSNHWDEGTLEKWKRLYQYHKEKPIGALRLEPLGFQQNIIIFHSAKGIAGLFNFRRKKQYIRLTKEENISKKSLCFNDETSFNSAELYITLPGERSRILKY